MINKSIKFNSLFIYSLIYTKNIPEYIYGMIRGSDTEKHGFRIGQVVKRVEKLFDFSNREIP